MTDATRRNPPRGMSRSFGEQGDTIQWTEARPMNDGEVAVVFRTLARLLVRHHRQKGDCEPNASPETRSSSLTVIPHPSPHHEDETV